MDTRVNYQDPLNSPLKRPSKRFRHRGTISNKNLWYMTIGASTASILIGCIMYYGMKKRNTAEKIERMTPNLQNPALIAKNHGEEENYVRQRHAENNVAALIQRAHDFAFWESQFWDVKPDDFKPIRKFIVENIGNPVPKKSN